MQWDDVDLLLKELEDLAAGDNTINTHQSCSTAASLQPAKPQQQASVADRLALSASLDALLHELQPHQQRALQPAPPAPPAAQLRPRCSATYLGGAADRRGRCLPLQSPPASCDALRCTACDCRVLWFDGQGWTPGVDYMHFRNSYPDALSTRLQRQQGSRAYCCQCSWASCTTRTRLSVQAASSSAGGGSTNQQALRWVCAGHN